MREIVRSGQSEVPALERSCVLDPHLDHIRELFDVCEGNRIRVVEKLEEKGITVPYTTLTDFCRRHRIGVREKRRAGRYHFKPGQEMQHDTSPHKVTIDGKRRTIQCASLVLCYSRVIFAKGYFRWRRFECKSFLNHAFAYIQGCAEQCMVDNASVVIAEGSGADARVATEMIAFAERFNFTFVAHEPGDANRSGRVERPFHYIEHNFYPGRTFRSFTDLNQQLRSWCERVNRKPKRHLEGTPLERLVTERGALKPLPRYVPPVYELHIRRIDVEGYISLYVNRYSMPTKLIGRQVEVREYTERLAVHDGPRLIVEHELLEPGLGRRVTLPEHHGDARRRKTPVPPSREETILRAAAPELEALVEALRRTHGGQARRAMRQLHRFYVDYPLPAIIPAVTHALEYGLTDLSRIEQMILRGIQTEFFRLPKDETDHG